MVKFTNGPWKATRVAPFSYQITTDHPHGHANYGVIVQEVRSEENARLIAAAPELYDAADELLGALADIYSHLQETSPERLVLRVREAGNKLAYAMRKVEADRA